MISITIEPDIMSEFTAQDQISEIDRIAIKFKEQAIIDELRKDGASIEIYFDTYHVLPMIQGYWELQKDIYKNIDTQIFDDERFLVKSLAYFGFIKNLRVLRPHAAELNNQLDKRFILPDYLIDNESIKVFLSSVGLDGLEKLKEASKKGLIEDYITGLRPHAENIFKANYVLSELVWTKRYDYLFDVNNPIVEYDDVKYNNSNILDSNLFYAILNELGGTQERKSKTYNNFRDALALCMFHQKIKQFRSNNVLPLFYVSGSILAKLPTEIKKEFQIIFRKRTINVLKDSEFFIMDSMFSETSSITDGKLFSKMKQLKQALNFYMDDGQTFLDVDINALVDNWKTFRNNDFFQKLWNDEDGGKIALSKIIKSLISYDDIKKNEDGVKKIIDQERNRIKGTLKEMVTDLVFLENIWKAVDSFNEFLKENINNENNELHIENADIFRDEGLTRFSPPRGNVERQIKQLWGQFLDSFQTKVERSYHLHKVELTKLLYDGFSKEGNRNFDSIIIGVSILWVFQKETLIIDIIDKLDFDYGDYYQLGLILVASMIKSNHKSANQMKKMEKVITCIEGKDWYKRNYKAWIGISYLKFNLWRINRNNLTIANEKQFLKYLEESIDLSYKAFVYLEKIKDQDDGKTAYRNVKYYYSLNNFIYYKLFSDPKCVDEVGFYDHIEKLQEGQDNENYRQSRSYDTLALYWYGRAEKAKSKEDKLNFINHAKEFSINAKHTAVLMDHRYQNLLDKIEIFKSTLNDDQGKNE